MNTVANVALTPTNKNTEGEEGVEMVREKERGRCWMMYWIVESALRSWCWNRCFDNPRGNGGKKKR